jgi:hypothetical protein
MFLQNVGKFPRNHTTSQPRREYCSILKWIVNKRESYVPHWPAAVVTVMNPRIP